jgi:lipoyl(octanoyl) transferase
MGSLPGPPPLSDAARPDRGLEIHWLGRAPYGEVLQLQQSLQQARIERTVPDTVLLCEHLDVITLGRRTRPENLRLSDEQLQAAGYQVHRVNRGGDVTWHGPGQLVGYPILDLEARKPDLHVYLRSLEDVLIEVLAAFGLAGRRLSGHSGVWLDEKRKIASIGIGVRRWVTLHGFALNVCCDLERFAPIVPCGLDWAEVTSMQSALSAPVPLAAVRACLERVLCERWA